MSRALFAGLLLFLAVVQTAILSQLRFLSGGLEPVTVIVLCWSLLRPEEGLVWAAAGGLFLDLFSGGPFGGTAIALVCASYAVGQLHGRLWSNTPFVVMGLVLAGTVFAHGVSLILLLVLGYTIDPGYVLLYATLPTAFLNILASIFFYLPLRNWHVSTLPPILAEEEE